VCHDAPARARDRAPFLFFPIHYGSHFGNSHFGILLSFKICSAAGLKLLFFESKRGHFLKHRPLGEIKELFISASAVLV
jgi:hypothetical protein